MPYPSQHPPPSSNCTPMNSEMRLTFRTGNKHPIHSPKNHMNGPAQSRATHHRPSKRAAMFSRKTTAQVRERSDILEFAKWMRQKKCHSLKNQRECGMSHWTNCQPPDFWKNPVAIWSERIIPEKTISCYTINRVPPVGHAYTYTPWFTTLFPWHVLRCSLKKDWTNRTITSHHHYCNMSWASSSCSSQSIIWILQDSHRNLATTIL